jgi:hypothetical protein
MEVVMDVRLIDEEGVECRGRVFRVTATILYIRTARGLNTSCHRKNGKPYGTKGTYTIHPDDLAGTQQLATTAPAKYDKRRSAGTPSHWDV